MNIKDYTIEEKISLIKEKFKNSAADTQQIIDGWEKEIAELKLSEEWIKNPNADKLRKALSSQKEAMENAMLNNENLSDFDRKVFFKVRNIINILLFSLSSSEEQMKSLEKVLENELI